MLIQTKLLTSNLRNLNTYILEYTAKSKEFMAAKLTRKPLTRTSAQNECNQSANKELRENPRPTTHDNCQRNWIRIS